MPLAERGLIEVLGGRDELDAEALKLHPDDDVVVDVPGEAGDVVDDQRVDVAARADATEELLN